MSSDIALRVRGLGKRYEIGARPYRYGTLRERIAASVARPWRRLVGREPVAGPTTSIWALEDVSFDVRRGEVLGIIGGNGAGKSTLLKILSRITEPTTGEAAIFGRVGSLLEVGTGFHPELTGRENIYLNGAILGMRKAEIERKFDDIVAFAEVDAFVDTPVRHYSSGMYVRLAFAVAAQLEPEILIIDEVLAVGDVRFQKKCLGKINDVARGGRTVLFVSHNMAAIQRLCTRALLLDGGRVVADGATSDVTARYLSGDARPTFVAAARTGEPQIVYVGLKDTAGRPVIRPLITAPLVIEIGYVLPHVAPGTCVGIGLLTADGAAVFSSDSRDAGVVASGAPDEYFARVTVPADTLLAGDFQLAVCLWNERDVLDLQEPALAFSMDPGASPLYQHLERRTGVVQVRCGWEVTVPSSAAV